MRLLPHVLFWILVTGFLTVTFGQAEDNYIKAFYYAALLLPAAMASSYLFNYFLVPKFLLQKRYWLFGLYTFYLVIFSAYLVMIILTVAFIVLANYEYKNLHPYSTNVLLLTSTLYFLVFIHAFILLIKRYQRKEHLANQLEDLKTRNSQQQITVRSDRKHVPIPLEQIRFIESLADYVKIHTTREVIITKEKISELEKRLPDHFLRVHRSFLVNKSFVTAFNREKLQLDELEIPLGRTFREASLEQLSG